MQQPRLRFKEFKDEWRNEQLKNKFDGIHNAFVGKASPYYTDKDNGHFYLESNNVKDGHINKNKQIFINDFFYNKQKNKWVHTNDLLMVQSGDIGSTAVVTKEFNNSAAHALIQLTNPINVDTFFLNSIFQNSVYRNKIRLITIGNTIKHILSSDVQSLFVKFPSISEQTKIGHYFQLLDRVIELQQAKLKHLRKLKSGYLQKMFTNENEPRLRFKGFNDKWKIKRIADISDVVGGGTPDTNEKEYWNGDINWYSPNEITGFPFAYESKRKITSLGLEKSSAKLHPINTILFTSRAGIGKMAILKKPAATNQGFQSLELNKNVNPYFIYSMQNKLKHKALLFAYGTTFLEISKNSMKKIKIIIPPIQEQTKIGHFFFLLDKQIELANQKLLSLQKTKKAYLQKMFI